MILVILFLCLKNYSYVSPLQICFIFLLYFLQYILLFVCFFTNAPQENAVYLQILLCDASFGNILSMDYI